LISETTDGDMVGDALFGEEKSPALFSDGVIVLLIALSGGISKRYIPIFSLSFCLGTVSEDLEYPSFER